MAVEFVVMLKLVKLVGLKEVSNLQGMFVHVWTDSLTIIIIVLLVKEDALIAVMQLHAILVILRTILLVDKTIHVFVIPKIIGSMMLLCVLAKEDIMKILLNA